MFSLAEIRVKRMFQETTFAPQVNLNTVHTFGLRCWQAAHNDFNKILEHEIEKLYNERKAKITDKEAKEEIDTKLSCFLLMREKLVGIK